MVLRYPLPYPQDPSPPPLVPHRPAELQYGNPYSTDTTARGRSDDGKFRWLPFDRANAKPDGCFFCVFRSRRCRAVSRAHVSPSTRGSHLHSSVRAPRHTPESGPRGAGLGSGGGLHPAVPYHDPT